MRDLLFSAEKIVILNSIDVPVFYLFFAALLVALNSSAHYLHSVYFIHLYFFPPPRVLFVHCRFGLVFDFLTLEILCYYFLVYVWLAYFSKKLTELFFPSIFFTQAFVDIPVHFFSDLFKLFIDWQLLHIFSHLNCC